MPFPDTPEHRYVRDPLFRQLVDMMHECIRRCQYSPTEMREAAILACIHHDRITVRSQTLYVDRAGNVSFDL